MKDAYKKFEAHFEAEIAKSNNLPKGVIKGKLFPIGVADGYAYYEIIKVNKKTVQIKWRKDLCPDEYYYYGWGESCKVNIDLIEPLLDQLI